MEKIQCDMCGGVAMYDAKTVLGGIWANLCEGCFLKYGIKLGLGYGQKLDPKQEDVAKC